MTATFATGLLGWKASSKNKLGWSLVPNFADVDNAESMRIGAGLLTTRRGPRGGLRLCRRTPGGPAGTGRPRSPCPAAAGLHPDRSGWWPAGRSSPSSTSTRT